MAEAVHQNDPGAGAERGTQRSSGVWFPVYRLKLAFASIAKHDPAGYKSGNSRNGKTSKTLKGDFGEMELETPRDRNATFEPLIVGKNQTRWTGFDDKILSLYARGISTRDTLLPMRCRKRAGLAEPTAGSALPDPLRIDQLQVDAHVSVLFCSLARNRVYAFCFTLSQRSFVPQILTRLRSHLYQSHHMKIFLTPSFQTT